MEISYIHIEDSEQDSLLIRKALERDGWTVRSVVVDSFKSLQAHLQGPWDLILADFNVPGLPTMEALALARAADPEFPFVVVSGQIGEENAVALMKAGVDDYVSKNFPLRLTPILKRLKEKRVQSEIQRAQEKKNKELEARFRHFFQKNLAGMAMISTDGEIQEINQALLDMLLLDSQKLPCLWDLFAQPEVVRVLLAHLKSHGSFGPEVVEFVRSDGEKAYVLSTYQLPAPEPLVWVNFIDHTEKQRLQQQMFDIQKRESLGQLAAGIAHEFNNVLTIILGQLSLCELDLEADSPFLARLSTVEQAANRGADTVRQLLLFARNRKPKLSLVPVRELLEETYRLVTGLLPENLVIQIDCQPDLPPLFCDRGLLGQALLNLIINAKDVMPDGGLILLKAGMSSGQFRLEVIDEGPGVPPEILPKIFDPYFSTKEEGKGTGLGLSIVSGVAQVHQGTCGAEPRFPTGSAFYLLLPQGEGKPEASSGIHESRKPLPKGQQKILLVEDEAAIKEFEQISLTKKGYQVTSVSSAEEAWELLQAAPEAYQLLLTDLGMPGMGGGALVKLLQTLPVKPKILIQTGNPLHQKDEWFEQEMIQGIIYKPFTLDELLGAIDEVLHYEGREKG